MRWNVFRNSYEDDFIGAPSWFSAFFTLYNQLISALNAALNNGLKLEDNMVGSKITIKCQHNTAKLVQVKVSSPISLVLAGYASTALSQPIAWTPAGNGAVNITASFVGSPTTEQTITLYLLA